MATPYLNPVGTAPGVVRLYPPETVDFVQDLSRQFTNGPQLRKYESGGRPNPLLGERRHVELLGRSDGEWIVAVWQHEDGPDLESIAVEPGGSSRIVSHVEVPQDVRRELQKGPQFGALKGFAGYAAPPRRVSIVALQADAGEVRLSWQRGDIDGYDVLNLADPALPSAADADMTEERRENVAASSTSGPEGTRSP